MKRKILFRADGNSSTGLGHLYRLFALVEMIKIKFEYVFITRESSTKSVIPESYNLSLIPGEVSYLEEPEWLKYKFDPDQYLIIADGYQFNSLYQKKIKEAGFDIFYIDDLATEHMFADVVVNHSAFIKKSDFSAASYTKFALGTDFSILRPLFIEAGKASRKPVHIRNVFVCFGGSDFFDLTEKSVAGLLRIKEIEKIFVILGGAYSHKKIFETIKGHEDRIKLCKNLSEEEMIGTMRNSHLAVIPASTICYEVCSVKMPILCGYYINNQINIYKGLVMENSIFGGDDLTHFTSEDFETAVAKIIKLPQADHEIKINNQQKLFDGNQKNRFIKLIEEFVVC